jgi:hypothetical protein
MELPELGQALRVFGGELVSRSRRRGRRRRHGRLLAVVVGLLLPLSLLALPVFPERVRPASDGGRAHQWATTSEQWHGYACPSSSIANPIASMISGAAAITFGPPTCGATAFSTPTKSSAVAPSSKAVAICHA